MSTAQKMKAAPNKTTSTNTNEDAQAFADATSHPQLFGQFSTLNGLRAVTLLWVMFVHLPSLPMPKWLDHIHNHWRFGVDFFFAISGFLVTRSLLQCFKKRGIKAGFREYVVRRLARILPPYYVQLVIVLALAAAFRGGLWQSLQQLGAKLLGWPFLYANYVIADNLPQIPHSLIILWSVSFQEQFYLLLGGIFVAVALISQNKNKSTGAVRFVLQTLALSSAVVRLLLAFGPWNTTGLPEDQFMPYGARFEFWLPLNFDGIIWGCLAWFYYDAWGKVWSSAKDFSGAMHNLAMNSLILLADLAIISMPSWCPKVFPDLTFEQTQAISMIFKAPLLALTVRMFCQISGPVARFLSQPWMNRLGMASYEIYLLHVLVYGIVHTVFEKKLSGLATNVSYTLFFIAVSYTISMIAGLVFYEKFGHPVQNWLKKKAG